MSEQTHHIDYAQGGDTGEDNTDAIQPIANGEGATQTVFRRPSENLRGRTEAVRDAVNELTYYRDFGHLVIEGATGHSITWAGSTTSAATGLITQLGALTVRPLLTPSTSLKGSLSVGTAGTDEITYTISATGYASQGMNGVFVEHVDAGAGEALSCTISDGPMKRIVVFFDSTNTAHDAAAAKVVVDAAVLADSDLIGKITVTTDAIASDAIAVVAETRIEGTADQEAHLLQSNALTDFTTLNPLAEGDAVAIWYRYLVEPAGFAGDPKGGVDGGRWESNPDRGTQTIPAASLFVTSTDPEKIPGAIPLCKVVNNELVWVDHSRFAAGATGPIGTSASAYIDASGFTGDKTLISNGGIATPLSPTTAQAAFDSVDSQLGTLRAYTFVCTDGTSSTGGDYNSQSAVEDAITALGVAGGTIFVRRGTYVFSNSLTLGNDQPITIIGEDVESVIFTQTAPTQFEITSNLTLRNVSIATAHEVTIPLTTAQAQLSNILVTGTSTVFAVSGRDCKLNNVQWTVDGPAVTPGITLDGTRCEVTDCYVRGQVDLSGTLNTVRNLRLKQISPDGTALLGGESCVYERVNINEFTSSLTSSATVLVRASGTNVTVDSLYVDATPGGFINDGVVLGFDSTDTNNVYVRNAYINASGAYGLFLSSTVDEVSVAFENCTIVNDSTSRDVLFFTGPAIRAVFTGCTFDDSEGDAPRTILVTDSADGNKIEFIRCTIIGAVSDGTPCVDVKSCVFRSCTFQLKNPVDGVLLIRTLPNDDDGVTDFWRFSGSTNMPSRVENCVFDLLDSEVVDAAVSTDPDFTGAFITATRTELVNPSVVNINQHIRLDAATPGGSLIALSTGGKLVNPKFHWTSTASVQAGTAAQPGWVGVTGNDVVIEQFRVTDPTVYTGIGQEYLSVPATECDDLVVRDCVFATEGDIPFNAGAPSTGNGFQYWLVDNNSFGTLLHEITGGTFAVPLSRYCVWRNNRFFVSGIAQSNLQLGASMAGAVDSKFTGNSIYSTVASPPTLEPIAVTSSELNGLVFTDNHISYLSDTGASNRSLTTGAPGTAARIVATGNVFYDREGTVTTDDGTLALTATSFGLP